MKSGQIRSYFWSVFSCIRTEYRKIRTRNNSAFGHFSRSECYTMVISFPNLQTFSTNVNIPLKVTTIKKSAERYIFKVNSTTKRTMYWTLFTGCSRRLLNAEIEIMGWKVETSGKVCWLSDRKIPKTSDLRRTFLFTRTYKTLPRRKEGYSPHLKGS